jgi:amino acid adenylation domain-containing protein
MRLTDRFFAAARRYPDQPAFDTGDRTVSYREAAAKVAGAASRLAAQLAPGDRVALNLAKSPEAIMLMLASLAAGLSYVPIDPAAPAARRELVLSDSGARALIVDDKTTTGWPDIPDVDVYVPAAELPNLLAPVDQTDLPSAGPDDTAYVLYTSGSTGRPKGVVITHGNAEAFVDWAAGYARVGPGDRVAVHAPLHFDLPVFDVYASLTTGATVCPVGERVVLFPQALLRMLRERRITVLYAVPSALLALLHRSTLGDGGLPDLRLLLYAGEEFHPGPLGRLMAALPGVEVHNLYGPIETNVVTALRIRPEHLRMSRVPLGSAVAGARIFLVDDGVPVTEPDQPGEMLVAGPSRTPGYLDRPELTAASRAQVHADGTVWTCHRTGDYATRDADGVLHFLGRRDGLVKTRGFRVELGEVEATLLRHPGVREAAVVVLPDDEHTTTLHAFATTATDIGGVELRQWCLSALPPYMVPATVTVDSDLPRTSTGKLARRELAERLSMRADAR